MGNIQKNLKSGKMAGSGVEEASGGLVDKD